MENKTGILVGFLFLCSFAIPGICQQNMAVSKTTLRDKIKGGWAGQAIGVTYGGPTEFKYQGTMVNRYQPIPWFDGYIKQTMLSSPGLYDDLYMDLTFVAVMEKNGIDAPVSLHAKAYSTASYKLWHANQAGRYNILHGIKPPLSGHWLNNPHADDIDFQIESDFSGLMAPGMPNTAAQIGDSIGHIMNYGDGWYGGVFIAAMYSMAFTTTDVNGIVAGALKTIPSQSTFYQCLSDVIRWHKEYPGDWTQTWFELQKKWTDEIGCPDGVFHAFDIDAKLNAAYVAMALLYGNGDYSETISIATHAGQDSDCNPSSAAGILGTLLGYEKIPSQWKIGLREAENIDFKYTQLSLQKVYDISFKHALLVIEREGGKVHTDSVTILSQIPIPVRLEQSFTGIQPIESISVQKNIDHEFEWTQTGTGFVLRGEGKPVNGSSWDYNGSFAFKTELYIDNQLVETADLPVSFTIRRHEIFWKYQLPMDKHVIRIKLLNPNPEYIFQLNDVLVYR